MNESESPSSRPEKSPPAKNEAGPKSDNRPSTPASSGPEFSDPRPLSQPENRSSNDSGNSSRSENSTERQGNDQKRPPRKRSGGNRFQKRGRNRRKPNRDGENPNSTSPDGRRGDDDQAPSRRESDDSRSNGEKSDSESGDGDRRESNRRSRRGRKDRRKEQRERDREREAAMLEAAPAVEVQGLTEISPKGFGFLRLKERGYQQHPDDVFITPEIVRIHGLRDGLLVKCLSKHGARGPQLTEMISVNGKEPEAYHNLPYFEELTAINPNKRLALETKPERLTTRFIDLMTPIGRGQRGLIVSPPRTGKTTFLEHIADGILENYEDQMHLIIMLIDERPEEVTNFQRLFPQADLFASSNDSDIKDHTRMSQLAIERAKRLVEAGEHVFILLDSITRLARAFNNAVSGGKKRGTQSGGIAVGALEIPRKLFAAARNTREGGSLTIIATALIETNFKMDEAIFQEFKGTGNMELVLDRQLAQNYVYPAVDINRSGTRREELLLPAHMLEKIYVIRRGLSGYKPSDAAEWLIKCMGRYPSNAQMLMDIKTNALA